MNLTEVFGIAWENIFIGLLGAGIVSVLTFSIEYIKNKRIEHKFPLSGNFITKYEDLVDNQIVVYTALAKLKQSGNKIHGETWLGTRKWILDGTIVVESGNVYGIYYSESPWDKSIGEFFLSIDANKKMRGLWSGYDSVNDFINSGKYAFEPMLEDIEIVNFLKKYSSQILHMADCELGKNYLDLSDLALFADKNSLSMCKIAKSGNKVIGFATSFVISVKDLQQQIHLTAKNLPKFVKASEQICMIKTVVVDGNYQGKGVGYALIESLLTEWHSAGINDFACIAWKSKDGINIKGLLESFGFTAYTEIKDYWKEDSTNEGFDCPVCGNPCHCSAVIYFGAF